MRTAFALLALACATAALAAAPLPGEAVGRAATGAAEEVRQPWLGLRLGGLGALNTVHGTGLAAGGAGIYALFDARDFLADVALDGYFGSDATFVAGGLGAYYPLWRGNTTPYLGGGLKLAWTQFGGDGTFGLQPFVAGGAVVGRSWYPQLRVEVGWFVNASREGSPADRGGRRTHGPFATLGLGF
jgi:hypothetical protein